MKAVKVVAARKNAKVANAIANHVISPKRAYSPTVILNVPTPTPVVMPAALPPKPMNNAGTATKGYGDAVRPQAANTAKAMIWALCHERGVNALTLARVWAEAIYLEGHTSANGKVLNLNNIKTECNGFKKWLADNPA